MPLEDYFEKIFTHAVAEMKKPIRPYSGIALLAVADYLASCDPLVSSCLPNDQASRECIEKWSDFAVQCKYSGPTTTKIQELNSRLLESTFVASHCYMTAADVFVFIAVFPFVSANSDRVEDFVGLFRWFTQMQYSIPRVPELLGAIDVSLDRNSPEFESKNNSNEELPKKSNCKTKAEKTAESIKKPAASNNSQDIEPFRLDIRVGKIVKVQKHADADSLYVEQIDIGEESTRTIVSGLVKHYKIDQMQDRMVLVLCNLKPAKMRGVQSQGMVLCASKDGQVVTLEPPACAVPGSRIVFDGKPGDCDVLLNPKKKIWESIQPHLVVCPEGVAGCLDREKEKFYKMVVENTSSTVRSSLVNSSIS